MRMSSGGRRVLPLALLLLAGACDQATAPSASRRHQPLPGAATASLGRQRGATNPACTHHWKGNSDLDWFADTNWVEGTTPGSGSSVCVDNGFQQPGPMIHAGQSASINALTVTSGGVEVGENAGAGSLTVALDADIGASGAIYLSSGSSLVVGQTVHIAGILQTAGSPQPAVVRSNVDLQTGGFIRLFAGNLLMDKVNLSFQVNGGDISQQFCSCAIDIPASTLNPAVVINSGSLGPVNLGAGSLTVNGGAASGFVLADADLVLGAGPYSLGDVTIRPPAGGSSTLTGDIQATSGPFTPVITVEGAGSGSMVTLQLIGSVANHGVIHLNPGAGAVLNVTGTGALTDLGGISTGPAGEVHLKVNLDDQYSFGWNTSTHLDKTSGSYTFANQLNGVSSPSPLVVENGATVRITPTGAAGGNIELHGAHMILESSVTGDVKNLLGSSLDLGTGFRDAGVGAYEQDATSSLTMKVAGLVPGVSHDRLQANTATLGGTFAITTASPFIGGLCGQFPQLISAGQSITGNFATATGLTLAPTRAWGVVSLANQVRLRGFNPTTKIGLEPNPVAVAEGGSPASYNICLSQQPTADVQVAFSADAQVFGQNNPTTFSTASWYQPQNFPIQATDDNIVEPLIHTGHMTHTASSADAFFNGAVSVLNANVTDNDGNADLALSITSGPTAIFLNQNFTVSLRDRDIGPTLSTGATITVPVNPAFRIVSTTGTSCAASGGIVTCQIAGVAAGGQVNFSFTLKPVQRGTFQVTMTLTGQQPDPNSTNNVLMRTVTVN